MYCEARKAECEYLALVKQRSDGLINAAAFSGSDEEEARLLALYEEVGYRFFDRRNQPNCSDNL